MSKTMMVCSGGGHLKQLFTLAERLGVAPGDIPNLFRLRSLAGKVLRQHQYDRAFSTGSSPAVAVLPMAVRRGASAHYIESAARADGPSMSGRILQRWGRVNTYTQYPSWQSERWGYAGSIYDGFTPGPDSTEPPS